MTRFFSWAALATLCFATSASADGMRKQAMPAAAPSCCEAQWGGLYVAGSVGYGIAVTDFDEQHSNLLGGTAANRHDLSATGLTGTVAVGYDHMLRNGLVAGIFADYTYGDLDGKVSLNYLTNALEMTYSDQWAVGARLGFVRSCCTMWYLTAGYAHAKVELEQLKANMDGYFLGGGVEQQIRSNLSLKLEYRFSDYGDTNLYTFRSGCCSQTVDVESQIHAVRLGVAYRFNADHYTPVPLK